MAKKQKTKRGGVGAVRARESDGAFMLKLVLYVVLGSLWVKVTKTGSSMHVPLPVGFALGLLLASHEHFKMERKIHYAALVIAALVGMVAPYGLFVNL